MTQANSNTALLRFGLGLAPAWGQAVTDLDARRPRGPYVPAPLCALSRDAREPPCALSRSAPPRRDAHVRGALLFRDRSPCRTQHIPARALSCVGGSWVSLPWLG